MNISSSIKPKSVGGAYSHKPAKKEQAQSVPAVAAVPAEQTTLKESAREDAEEREEKAEHIQALREAFETRPAAASKKTNSIQALPKSQESDDDDDKKVKSKAKGKAKGHAKKKAVSRSAKPAAHSKYDVPGEIKAPLDRLVKSKDGDDDDDVKDAIKDLKKRDEKAAEKAEKALEKIQKADEKAREKAEKADEKAKDKAEKANEKVEKATEKALDKIKDANEDAEDDEERALGKLNDAGKKALDKINDANEDALDDAKDSGAKAVDKAKDASEKAVDKAKDALDDADDDSKVHPGKGPKSKEEAELKERPKEVVRTEARAHTQKSVESHQEAVRHEQRSIGQTEVVKQRTTAIKQAAPVAPTTPAPKIEVPKIEERAEKTEQTDPTKPEKLKDRKPLKLEARPDEQKTENLPLATRGSTQTRLQISPETSSSAVDAELDAQNDVGRENTRALEQAEVMRPKALERNEQIEKAQTKTGADIVEKNDELQKGQNRLIQDEQSVTRAEEARGDAKKRVVDGTQKVKDGESQIMTRERQIDEATTAVSEAGMETIEAGEMKKKADIRLDDAMRRFNQGKFDEDDDSGKSKEERDLVLRRAVASAQDFQEKATDRVKVAKQRETDAKKGVTVATDRLGEDEQGLQESKEHLEGHEENNIVTKQDLETARKNVETGQTEVQDRREMLAKLQRREEALVQEAEHNELVRRHLRESAEPLQENIRNQQENVEILQALKASPGTSQTVELKEMREIPTPQFGAAPPNPDSLN